MSFDASRFTFHPWSDYLGVVMQQGRVQLDSDWNAWVAQLGRRLQAGTMDTVGRAVVPRTTPEGFHILAAGGAITIGVGRMYVDGLLAENHGNAPVQWDANLAEQVGSTPVNFLSQPYLPFNASNQPAPADIFNAPTLSGGPHLAYLDVWQREVTPLQDPDLIEKAVGIDTTGRLQTVWQVKLLPNVGSTASCQTPDGELPGWAALTRPSGARLSNSTGDLVGQQNPCLAPPAAGYKGLENQLYRVEIHRGGPQATATFKWSRDNATVATRVMEIQGGNRLVVESLGRDDVLGFHPGDWIEILDDWHELHGQPGRLHRIRPADGIDVATRSVILESALPAGLFPVDGQGKTDPARHTRIRRWDQSGTVRRANGTQYHDLDASPVSDGIPVPPPGTKLALENGVLVDFSLIAGGEYRVGDHWVFAARTSDGSIEPLVQAPPRGIHHHYARLAIVTLPDTETDCRIFWPPEAGGESCDCTVCVHAEEHNAGTATIQQAIDFVRARGGGTICLDIGTYLLRAPLDMSNVRSLRMRGQGWGTVLQPTVAGGAIDIRSGIGVTLENFSIVGIASGDGTSAMIDIVHGADIHLDHLTIAAAAANGATSAAVSLAGVLISAGIRDCIMVAEEAVVSAGREPPYLLSANLELSDNVLIASQRGVALTGACLHYGHLRLSRNLILICAEAGIALTGAALPVADVAIEDNVLQVSGSGIVAGTDQLRIADNEVVGMTGRRPGNGIELVTGFGKGVPGAMRISGNRLNRLIGHGISIERRIGLASFSANTVDSVRGGALIMNAKASADYLSIEGNQFLNLGLGFNHPTTPYFGVLLLATKCADVNGNLFANVARQAALNPLRAAFMALATEELRVAGNRIYGLAPLTSFNQRAVGIAVLPGFDEVAIDDNTVERLGTDTEAAAAAWQALMIIGTFVAEQVNTAGAAVAMPDVAIADIALLPAKSAHVYLSNNAIALVGDGPGSAMIRGNRLRSHNSQIPATEVLAVRGCLFDQNDINASGGTGNGALAGHVLSDHANLANNRLIAMNTKQTFELQVTPGRFAVLGNLRSAPIFVNGIADSALPAPWNALNVTIS